MTMTEFLAGYAYLLPEPDVSKEFVPFTDEEQAILDAIERKIGNGDKH